MMKIVDNTTRQAQNMRMGPRDLKPVQPGSRDPQGIGALDDQGDKVMLSELAARMRGAMQTIHDMPEVREDRIAVLKSSIQNGTYRIDPETVAARIFDEAFFATA
ncbi:flagellar biosynthesis anti-sigma factor FlgM [Desulfatirhabdium butyrativorans]|uniref:flagellar biosynthesis anti-sigma factor FlgM n=1 Tax=Desulfatirhabdium butyrativorans TaxID=340467 RepID=UPI000557D76E|nr:flagellar biosynthesis anti-sigma factor FlgM [Desulfatirhabdium butyrativorans]